MKQKLPKIKPRNQDFFITAHYFSTLNKKFKLKKDNFATEEDIQDDVQSEYERQYEERKINIENQKYLIKIYDSNYSELFDKIKNEYYELKEPSLTDRTNKNKLPRVNIGYSEKDKSGFEKFAETNYINQQCMKEFYNKYSKFDSLCRKHPLKNLTPSWAFIKSSNEQRIIPNPLGLVRRGGEVKNLVLSNQKVGDNYMRALSSSLRYSHHLSKLEFSGNRLSSLGTSDLFRSLNNNKDLAYNLRSIDLSDNKIGNNKIDELLQFIQDPKCNIEDLNFYGNFIGDDNIIKICESLAQYVEYRLVTLNLGKNNIHDTSSNSICQMISKCSGLRLLNLSHNWLCNQGATKIIKELSNHYELRILDLSWNCIGDDLTAVPTYEHLVNSELTHPEREFNNFSMNEALSTGKLNLRNNPLLPPIDTTGGKKNKIIKKKIKKLKIPLQFIKNQKKLMKK